MDIDNFDNFDYLNAGDSLISIHQRAGRLLGIMMGELENQRRTDSFENWEHHAAERDRQILQLQKAVYTLACVAIELGGRVSTLEEKARASRQDVSATESTSSNNMRVVGLSPTQKVLYRPGVQIAYVIKDGEMRILSQVPGKCYAAARDYIRSKTMVARVMWGRDCTYISPNDGTIPRGTHPGGSWAEMRVGGETVGWIQA